MSQKYSPSSRYPQKHPCIITPRHSFLYHSSEKLLTPWHNTFLHSEKKKEITKYLQEKHRANRFINWSSGDKKFCHFFAFMSSSSSAFLACLFGGDMSTLIIACPFLYVLSPFLWNYILNRPFCLRWCDFVDMWTREEREAKGGNMFTFYDSWEIT